MGCTMSPSPGRHTGRGAAAFSLAEVLVSLVLASGLVVVSLNTVGSSALGRRVTSEHACGQLLALSLMTEIMQQPYKDLGLAPLFGLEVGELDVLGGTRVNFDDVDDYDNLSESPPKKKAGTAYTDRSDWTRTVAVSYADPNNLALNSLTDQGLKRITVVVKRNGRVMAQLVALRGGAVAGGLIQRVIEPALLLE
ncbi:MAG: hypothetical protein HY763_08665 [Planctomycetes bacterium]|nr:hypothetical protein [Planctomycetota bacterium]